MSLTETIALRTAVHSSRTPSLKEKISFLIEKMQKASFFSDEEKNQIREWVVCFKKHEDKKPLALSDLLCDLLTNVVHQAVLNPSLIDPEIEQLRAFDKTIKELLKLSLCTNVDVDAYIRQYKDPMDEFMWKQQLIEDSFSDQQQVFFASANETNELINTIASRTWKDWATYREALDKPLQTLDAKLGFSAQEAEKTNAQLFACAKKIESLSFGLQDQQK